VVLGHGALETHNAICREPLTLHATPKSQRSTVHELHLSCHITIMDYSTCFSRVLHRLSTVEMKYYSQREAVAEHYT